MSWKDSLIGPDRGPAFDKRRPSRPETPGPDGMYEWERFFLGNLRTNPHSPYERFYLGRLRSPAARAEAQKIIEEAGGVDEWINMLPPAEEIGKKQKRKKAKKKTAKKPAKRVQDPSRWEMMAKQRRKK